MITCPITLSIEPITPCRRGDNVGVLSLIQPLRQGGYQGGVIISLVW